ncbi:hypothetical protein F8M49_28460 [Rhodococcus zopfii]|uniref:Uncharacterized protein n=1 Tax=Rhodococcus zopfii TaxID=43772 RepID=A0ABU3WWJ0_9NOCA|nr:hypothetical protein [Rhodococcus zopfii]
MSPTDSPFVLDASRGHSMHAAGPTVFAPIAGADAAPVCAAVRTLGDAEPGRLRSGARAATGAAACVVVPSWAVTGSVVVAVAATLAILLAVAAASIMI